MSVNDQSHGSEPEINDTGRVSEPQIPPSYSAGQSGSPQLRLLDDFAVFNGRGWFCSLDVLEQGACSVPQATSVCVRGVVLQPDDGLDPRPGACANACLPASAGHCQRAPRAVANVPMPPQGRPRWLCGWTA